MIDNFASKEFLKLKNCNMIKNFLINFFQEEISLKDKIGYFTFFLGVFLLPSAMALSILFFIVAISISFINPNNFFKDKWNYPFFMSSFFMLMSSLKHFENTGELYKSYWEPSLSLIGLLNWIPLFFFFWGFQKYLNRPEKRMLTSKIFICGSIPVIISGILQLLNINGPLETLNGLVIWYQKPLTDFGGSLSGLFNNQNYAGLWMVMIWPFCLAANMQKNLTKSLKFIVLLICLSFSVFIFLTDSRNAFLCFLISTPLVLGKSSLLWYLPTLLISFSFLALAVLPIFPEEIQIFAKSIVPSRIYTKFPEIGFNNLIEYPRISKWASAFGYILQKPLFGWGAAAFPIIYRLEKGGAWFGHAHNLPLDLAVSYGLFPSLLIFSSYLLLLLINFKKYFLGNIKNVLNDKYIYFQRAWFTSSLVFLISHLSDVLYFDGRISIICWILLAGLRCAIKEKD